MAQMSDKAKWGYLAGLMDGEGHISISRSDKPKFRTQRGNGKQYPCPVRYGIAVAVSNTDVRLMNKLVELFGGSCNGGNSYKKHPRWKPKYQWNVNGNKNKELILLAVLPYLVLKREQAIVALAFIRLADEKAPEKRQLLYEQMITLNKRGILVETNTSCDSEQESVIESELAGNSESEDQVTDLKVIPKDPAAEIGGWIKYNL